MPYKLDEQNARREQWFKLTRKHIGEWVERDGSGRIPQFNPPYREPVWILPALYTGSREDVDLANRMVARYHDPDPRTGQSPAKAFNIFQSNNFAHSLHRFEKLLTPAAHDVMVWQTEQVFKTYKGSAQSDFKFHGANDNMPMMASCGLILGGEALGNKRAVEQGVWNLNQFRRLLSRAAWASEFNSSTYSPITLKSAVQIANFAHNAEVRQLARQIEHRLWAELLLHYHPGTMHQAGPQSRAYSVDYAGHNHTLQFLFWLVFGPEMTGRDLAKSYFEPDGSEVIHFEGQYAQSIAEFCDVIDGEFHVPEELAHLIAERRYPAILRGRSEAMSQREGMAGAYHTETYMEEDFSLGTVDSPMCGGEQTASLYVTYKRLKPMRDWRDAATVFFRYKMDDAAYGTMNRSSDGGCQGEKFQSNLSWAYALQKKNVALLLTVPNLTKASAQTNTLKLGLLFPAHYGKIERSIIGTGPVQEGGVGESEEVVPVSVDAGVVFMHIQPLLPTSLPRKAAVRFTSQNRYEVLEFINYEGPERAFSRAEYSRVLNGFVLTVAANSQYASLEEFHRQMSKSVVTDYFSSGHRFFLFQRDDVEFEVVLTTDPSGVQTEAVDGRQVPRPIFESNQVDVSTLPFMQGAVARNAPCFPWPDLEMYPYDNAWLIGSRGLPEEVSYSRRVARQKE